MCMWSKFSYDSYEKSLTWFFSSCLTLIFASADSRWWHKKMFCAKMSKWHGMVKAKINHGTNINKTIKIPARLSTQQLIIDGGMGKEHTRRKKKKITYKHQKLSRNEICWPHHDGQLLKIHQWLVNCHQRHLDVGVGWWAPNVTKMEMHTKWALLDDLPDLKEGTDFNLNK